MIGVVSAEAIARHLDAALGNDAGFSEPFRVHSFTPFADDLYTAILAHLPGDEFYRYMMHRDAVRPDGTSTRLVLLLKDERIGVLPEAQRLFWRDLVDALNSPAVRDVFRKHLARELRARFGTPVEDIPFYPAPMLLRDLDGYKITPHPDTSIKICTIQLYLPADDSQRQLGTSFYRRLADGTFETARTLEFRPNTGYCFTVTENSWHGALFDSFAKPRNSLMLTYYREPFDGY